MIKLTKDVVDHLDVPFKKISLFILKYMPHSSLSVHYLMKGNQRYTVFVT